GDVLGAHGMTLEQAAELAPRVMEADREATFTILDRTVLVAPLRNGFMAVEVGPYTPFFAQEEVDLLEQLGAFVDLALGRAELFEKERAARVALEGAHNELEDLVYSLSHDLKSPLISILG